MPLTPKGEEIKSALTKEYGPKKGEQVLYAGANKGTFTGIHDEEDDGGPGSGPRPGGGRGERGSTTPGDPTRRVPYSHKVGTTPEEQHESLRQYSIGRSPEEGEAMYRSGGRTHRPEELTGKERGRPLPGRDEEARPPEEPRPPKSPSQISNLVGARDQPAYRQAGPESMSLESIQKKNKDYWASEWGKRGDRR